jgi:hypothetical protein
MGEMYYASNQIRLPKRKVAVSMTTGTGEILDGNVFAFGDQRVSDLLRTDDHFVPFETKGGEVYLLNQAAIVRVVPREEESEPVAPIVHGPWTEEDISFEVALEDELARLDAMAAARRASADDGIDSMWSVSENSTPAGSGLGAAFGAFLRRLARPRAHAKKSAVSKNARSKVARFSPFQITTATLAVLTSITLAYATMQYWAGGVDYAILTADYGDGAAAYARSDYDAALREFEPLAERGHAEAQASLGRMYEKGYGLPRDYDKAMKWYRLAGDQGHAEAQYGVGMLFRNGFVGQQDFVQAHIWFSLAAVQGHDAATRRRDEVVGRMSDVQLAEARRLAQSWQVKHGA